MRKLSSKNFLALALSTLVLFSCGKDDDKTVTPDNPNNPSNQKCRIANVTEDGGDEESVFEYDSQRRLVKQVYKEGGVLETYYETYEYNAAGYISKSMEWDGSTLEGYDLYTYNADGRLTRRESYYDNGTGMALETIRTYEYDANKRLTKKNYMEASAPTVVFEYATYTYPTGNSAREQNFYDMDSDGTLDLSSTVEYTYDDKKSPQLLLGVAYDDEFLSEHNPIRETYTYSGSSTSNSTYTYTYVYNAEGFPTKITADYGGTTPEVVNVTYNCN